MNAVTASVQKTTVVIVGSSGIVGIDLAERLEKLSDCMTVVGLSRTHSLDERQEILRAASIAVLCLPEEEAIAFAQEALAYPQLASWMPLPHIETTQIGCTACPNSMSISPSAFAMRHTWPIRAAMPTARTSIFTLLTCAALCVFGAEGVL